MNELYQLISEIRYQLPLHVTTWSYCSQGCGRPARGGRKCIECLRRELQELTDHQDDACVDTLIESLRTLRDCEAKLEEMLV